MHVGLMFLVMRWQTTLYWAWSGSCDLFQFWKKWKCLKHGTRWTHCYNGRI